MAYSTTNPPIMKTPAPLAQKNAAIAPGGATWVYKSADVLQSVQATGYFSNGANLGMQVGDLVEVHEVNTIPYKVSTAVVSTIANGAATLGVSAVGTYQ
jgi:hypothetical protein